MHGGLVGQPAPLQRQQDRRQHAAASRRGRGHDALHAGVALGGFQCRFLEKYTLSKWQQYWKDQVANWYGMFLHESQYLEPVMRDIEAMLQESQRNVNGTAILELRPLSFSTVGVESKDDLVKTKFGEYGEMQKGWTAEDAKGFIKVTSTPLRVYYNNHKDEEI